MDSSRPLAAKLAFRDVTPGVRTVPLHPMVKSLHPVSVPTHGLSLLQRLPAQDLRYILSHRNQVKELVREKSRPTTPKLPSRTVATSRLRSVVRAMGFKSPRALADALLALGPRAKMATAPTGASWSRRSISPDKRAAIVTDLNSGGITIKEAAAKHAVSAATISRVKRWLKKVAVAPVAAVAA